MPEQGITVVPSQTEEVTSSIHAGIANVLSNICADYGVQIHRIDAAWLNVSEVGGARRLLLTSVSIMSETHRQPREG